MTEDDEKKAFSARLNEMLNDIGVPPKGKARQLKVAERVGYSQNAVRKWLEAEGYPNIDKARALAVWGNVNFEWLMTGRGAKRLDSQPAAHQAQEARATYNPTAAIQRGAEQLSREANQLAANWLKLPPESRARALQAVIAGMPAMFDAATVKAAAIDAWRKAPKTVDGKMALRDGERFAEILAATLTHPPKPEADTPVAGGAKKENDNTG